MIDLPFRDKEALWQEKDTLAHYKNVFVIIAFLIVQTLSPNLQAQQRQLPDFGKRGDLDYGFDRFKEPKPMDVGGRTLSVLIQQSRLDQTTVISRRPRAGKLRVELQYKRAQEQWQTSPTKAHSVIPQLKHRADLSTSRSKVQKLIAVLPQITRTDSARLPSPDVRPPYMQRNYYRNPIKFKANEIVQYRWVMVNDRGAMVRPKWRVGSFRMPRPYSLALMGDSFAAGEGAPNDDRKPFPRLPAVEEDVRQLRRDPRPPEREFSAVLAEWSHRGAHRSNKSGMVLAVEQWKQDNPEVWVEYIHTAISSATMSKSHPDATGDNVRRGGMYADFSGARELFLDAWLGGTVHQMVFDEWGIINSEDNVLPAQMSQIELWLGRQKLNCADAVVMTGGGNDGGFAKIIEEAVRWSLEWNRETVRGNFTQDLDSANDHVEQFFTELNDYVRPTDIHWVNYPNLTRNSDEVFSSLRMHPQTLRLGAEVTAASLAGATIGAFLGAITSPLPFLTADDYALMVAASAEILRRRNANPLALAMSFGVSQQDLIEAEWLLTQRLNPRVEDWCGAQDNCNLIDIEDNSFAHGVVAGDHTSVLSGSRNTRWFNTFIDSSRHVCGGLDCSIHPTAAGFEGIYKEEIYQGIDSSFARAKKADKQCGPLPSVAKLRDEWAEREEIAAKISIENQVDHVPLKPGETPDEEKEMRAFFHRIHDGDRSAAEQAIRAYLETRRTRRMPRI